MLTDLRTLDVITYRGALALHFSDAVTGQAVTGGLDVRAWRHDAADPRPAHHFTHAERSQQSGIYGFPTLPGLEGYQIGETVTPGGLEYLVQIVDRRGRFLPQTRHFALPQATPQAVESVLFSTLTRPIPTGYAAIYGELLRTSVPAGVPPEITVLAPATWARVTVVRPADIPGDPPLAFHGYADARGNFVVMIPYPLITDDMLLDEALWNLDVNVAHDPAAIEVDQALLERLLPIADPATRAPLQATLEAQPAALLFDTVTIVDADAQIYNVIGPLNETQTSLTLQFGQSPVVRTAIDASAEALSELLIQAA